MSKFTTMAAEPSQKVHLDVAAVPGLRELWMETLGDPEVCVAVLDGPVDVTHRCFAEANLASLKTLVSGIADEGLSSQHGTYVASLIFGQHGPGSVQGIAPKCRGLIVPIFADGPEGSVRACSQLDLARAITQAVLNGAHVINISAGQFTPSGTAHPILADAVRRCADAGVLIVSAAGNDGCQCLHLPGALPSVLAVGAMNASGEPLEFSNWGGAYQEQGILAPGEQVRGAAPGGKFESRSGTSVATPIVSGIVALLLSIQRKQRQRPDPFVVREALLQSAIDCDSAPISDCQRLLAGRLNCSGSRELLLKGELSTMSDTTLTESVEVAPSGDPAEPQVIGPVPEVIDPVLQAQDALVTPQTIHAAVEMAPTGPPALNDTMAVAPEDVPVVPAQVLPSACSCSKGGGGGSPGPQAVYALGTLGTDFGTEARRDSISQAMGNENPHDPTKLLEHLSANPWDSSAIIWTLNLEATPIYAVMGGGAYGAEIFARLAEYFSSQLNKGVDRVSIPGWISGSATLINGQTVPVIWAEPRGMYCWTTPALIAKVRGKNEDVAEELANFLDRVYYEIQNLGVTPQERAINFAATNAFQVGTVYLHAIQNGLKLDKIDVERSPVCRPESDCWDVKLTFFDPTKRQEQARIMYRFTIDVSDVVPVTIGTIRHWHVY